MSETKLAKLRNQFHIEINFQMNRMKDAIIPDDYNMFIAGTTAVRALLDVSRESGGLLEADYVQKIENRLVELEDEYFKQNPESEGEEVLEDERKSS